MDKQNGKMKPWYKLWWFWLIIAFIVLLLGGVSSGLSGESFSAPVRNSEIDKHKSSSGKTVSSAKASPSIPHEYLNALKSATRYADYMHMSKRGIYDQLRSEYGNKFSSKAAYYGATHVQGVDWNKNALETAKTYDQEMNMSPDAIYDQLISNYGNKFTPSQARYAVNHLSH